jgi:hypothetical protein
MNPIVKWILKHDESDLSEPLCFLHKQDLEEALGLSIGYLSKDHEKYRGKKK